MIVMARSAKLVALAAVLAAAWGVGARLHGRSRVAPAHADVPESAARTGAVDGTCSDPIAMEANANLVGQVREYKRRLDLAEERTREAESKLARAASVAAARLAAPQEEWARMAREGTVRLRVPCGSWDHGGRFSLRRAVHGGTVRVGSMSRHVEMRQRAEAAGLTEEELESLAEVYRRVQSGTWAAMKASCEANAEFRESMTDPEDTSDESRISACRAAMLDVTTDSGRLAIANVAQLRAVGATSERARDGAERVMFALTNAPQALDDEMARTFGREKAKRAIDNGVVCFDETLFDLKAQDSDG
jgi:hypothetical protein